MFPPRQNGFKKGGGPRLSRAAAATTGGFRVQVSKLVPTNGSWLLSFSGAPGTGYAVESSTNLVTWQPLAVLTDLTGTVFHLIPTTNLPQRFFRVSAPK